MLMMHIKQKMSLILLLSFLYFRQVTFAQVSLLHPDEAAVVRRIATTLGATLTNQTDDPCQSEKLSVIQTKATEEDIENNIVCNCNNGTFCHVTSFRLKTMSLQGKLPPELVNLPFLQEIDLTRNYLSGELPKEWASMRHLNRISINAAGISGEIPVEWGCFANLTYLSLEANRLSGTIPEELGNLVSLTVLILSSNQFVGSLPKKLANLTNLTDFRISDNSFNGSVPEFIGRWTKLKRLEMYSSGLEGPINQSIFDLGNLEDLRITDMTGPKFIFPNLNSTKMTCLVLRNLSMSGSIPAYIYNMVTLQTLDLTFNKLEGRVKAIYRNAIYIFLSGNMLTGAIPNSFLNTEQQLDLSYNNFTSPTSCPESRSRINMYRSFSWEHNMSGLLPCPRGSSCQKYYQSIHINCGGPNVNINHTVYEGDEVAGNGAILNHDSGTKWGFISAGYFMNDLEKNKDKYIVQADKVHLHSTEQPELYSTARGSPLFLTYYGYCLENDDYTVNLHFAEILFKDEEPYYRNGRRIFDIYIQGKLELKDFNIKEQANGTGKAIIKTINTTVIENTLEIRLYWAGKGTNLIPNRGYYGPLISAISVCRGKSCNSLSALHSNHVFSDANAAATN